jgi:hypothetical protein
VSKSGYLEIVFFVYSRAQYYGVMQSQKSVIFVSLLQNLKYKLQNAQKYADFLISYLKSGEGFRNFLKKNL